MSQPRVARQTSIAKVRLRAVACSAGARILSICTVRDVVYSYITPPVGDRCFRPVFTLTTPFTGNAQRPLRTARCGLGIAPSTLLIPHHGQYRTREEYVTPRPPCTHCVGKTPEVDGEGKGVGGETV